MNLYIIKMMYCKQFFYLNVIILGNVNRVGAVLS